MSALTEQWSDSLQSRAALPYPAHNPEWLQKLRVNAAASFRENGLPQRRDEAWKYTPLRSLETLAPQITGQPANVPGDGGSPELPQAIVDDPSVLLRVIDGAFQAELPQAPAGVTILPLMQGIGEYEERLRECFDSLNIQGSGRGFEALNTALLGEGLLIHVEPEIDAGSVLIHWANSGADCARLASLRLVVLLEQGARFSLVEQFQSRYESDNGLNIIMHAELGPGARLDHTRLQYEADSSTLITSTLVEQAEASRYDYSGFDLGGGLVRHELRTSLKGAGAQACFNGAFVPDGLCTVDNHICADHAAPGCSSEQFFRGVLGGRSRGVFNGKAIIRPGADGSMVRQSNANLLLSAQAEMDTKPELEIYADEVEASHGATVGQLDESAVFYLRTRGLSEDEARLMLTGAFCQAVTERLLDRGLASRISTMLDQAMPAKTIGN